MFTKPHIHICQKLARLIRRLCKKCGKNTVLVSWQQRYNHNSQHCNKPWNPTVRAAFEWRKNSWNLFISFPFSFFEELSDKLLQDERDPNWKKTAQCSTSIINVCLCCILSLRLCCRMTPRWFFKMKVQRTGLFPRSLNYCGFHR